MRYTIGKSEQEKKNAEERARNWQEWFAWHPISLGDNKWVWLEPVLRRMPYYPYGWNWEYQLLANYQKKK